MSTEQEPMMRGWFGAGGSTRLWGGWGTYQFISPEFLPPVTKGNSDEFAWLRSAPDPASPLRPVKGGNVESRLDALTAEANELGLKVPPALRVFMLDSALHGKVLSCTACYLDLPAKLIPLPDENTPGRLLRFMNDQQCCLLWYLHLLPDGKYTVVCASPEFKGEGGSGEALEDRIEKLHHLVVCADGLEEFFRRFWVENWVWFDEHVGRELKGEFKEYVEFVKKAQGGE
jgi:hypothetical protein